MRRKASLRVDFGGEMAMEIDPKYRIRTELDDRNYTYETLGDEIGISHQAVSKIVNGQTTGATARYALAKALDREVDEFWPRES